MIKANMIPVGGDLACEVEVDKIGDKKEMFKLEHTIELMSIYQALVKAYGFDDAMDVMTNAFKMFTSHLD